MATKLCLTLIRDSYNSYVTGDLEVEIGTTQVGFKIGDRRVEVKKEDAVVMAKLILTSEE